MRWFKHMTDTADDEKIAQLIDIGGYEYYGLWWRMLEIIAKQMDGTGRTHAEYSLKFWASLAKVSPRKWSNFVQTTSKLSLNFLETSGKLLKISVPNLRRYRDEYTKKLSKCPDKLRTNSGQTPDSNPDKLRSKNQMQNQMQNQKKESPISPKAELSKKPGKNKNWAKKYKPKIFDLWLQVSEKWQLTNRTGGKKADKGIERYVKTEEDGQRTLSALKIYLERRPAKYHTENKSDYWSLEWLFRAKDFKKNDVDRIQDIVDGVATMFEPEEDSSPPAQKPYSEMNPIEQIQYEAAKTRERHRREREELERDAAKEGWTLKPQTGGTRRPKVD